MRTGTAYFVDRAAAIKYYRNYGATAANVERKITAGEIHLGKPELKAGERLTIIDNGTRYAIEDSK